MFHTPRGTSPRFSARCTCCVCACVWCVGDAPCKRHGLDKQASDETSDWGDFFFSRWVATFQHTLRMLWETHVHSTGEGVMRQVARGNSGQGGGRVGRQGSAEARGGASARDGGARGTVEGFSRSSAGHAHLVVADVVPPFVEAPPL